MIWRNLGLIALFLIGWLIITILWLRWYTHHGQSLILPDYVGQSIDEAISDARKHTFEIRIIDSVFIVGKDGGIILDQNPQPASKVKEKRKIYVTVTKDQPDMIPMRRLPVLYGKDYNRKQKELKQGFEINTRIIGRRFDSGAPDHILEVIYDGETIVDGDSRKDNVMIEKGGTLEMILSKSSGGSLTMPDLTCKTYQEAAFQLQTLNLNLGEVAQDDTVSDLETAYVWKQQPSAERRVYTGDTVQIFVTQIRPSDCMDL